jgi:DNA-binding response OmpR family regulator
MQDLRGGAGTVLCVGDEAIRLNRRCSFLKKHGWRVLTSGAAHEGIIRFSEEQVDVTILDFASDGVQAALVAGELKRLRPQVPVIMLVPDDPALPEDVLQCADVAVPVSDPSHLLNALKSLLRDSGQG